MKKMQRDPAKFNREAPLITDTANIAMLLDEQINGGVRMKTHEWQALTGLLREMPEYDPKAGVGEPLQIGSISFFGELLTKKAWKVYNTPAYNTVYEFNENLSFWSIEDWKHKYSMIGLDHSLLNKQLGWWWLLTKWKGQGIRRASLVQFLGKTFYCDKEDNLKEAIIYMANVMNICVEKGWLSRATLCPVMIIPLARLDDDRPRAMILLYVVSDYEKKELDGFIKDVFNQEGALPPMMQEAV